MPERRADRFFQLDSQVSTNSLYVRKFQAPGPEIFDPEKNLLLDPETGPDFKFSLKTGPKPGFSNSRNGNRPFADP